MRTDRTSLCGLCSIRFSPAPRCPACGTGRVIDLRDAPVEEIRRALQRHATGALSDARSATRMLSVLQWYEKRKAWFLVLLPMLLAGVMAVSLGLFLARMLVFFWVLAFLPTAIATAVVHALLEGRAERQAAEARRLTVAIHHPAALLPSPAVGRSSVRGRVRVVRAVVSPAGGARCAAFRLTGAGTSGDIDDGGAGTFAVDTDDGESILVEADPCSADLGPAAPAAKQKPRGELARFLRARGVLLSDGDVTLRETLLRDGDEVLIEGASEVESRPDGYRGTASVRVYRDRDGAPLRITAGSPASPAPPAKVV